MPYFSSTASASANVVGSGTVGPEAITAGSSPGTSEMTSVTTCAGAQAAASRPPLIADRCLRTQFISAMLAPALEQRLVDRLLVARASARGGQRQQRGSAAGDQAQHQVVGGEPAHAIEDARPLRVPPRRAPDARLRPPRCAARHGMAVARDDQTGSSSPGQWSSTACAMDAAALPAPTTMVRPCGGAGRCGGTQTSGKAAATAASNSARKKTRGSGRVACVMAESG